jgi:proteasome lid subunit RPN8/RPN11
VLIIAKDIAEEIIKHALDDLPNECCGILAGTDGTVLGQWRVLNSEASPYRYRMDPKEFLGVNNLIEERDWDLLAFYHSHTKTEAYPSDTDVRLARLVDWPEAYYLLVSLMSPGNPVIRGFSITDKGVAEVHLEIVQS